VAIYTSAIYTDAIVLRSRPRLDNRAVTNRDYVRWRGAIATNDTFLFAKVGGDKELLMRAWRRLKEYGADPMSADMLILRDITEGLNAVVEKATVYDRLEIILNDVDASDRDVIARLSQAFYG
jgi:hypothetical protein